MIMGARSAELKSKINCVRKGGQNGVRENAERTGTQLLT